MTDGVLAAREVSLRYPQRGVRGAGKGASALALAGVSLQLREGEVLGVVGASGSGKSSLVRSLACLTPVNAGEIYWLGRRVDHLQERRRRPLRRWVQVVFQDPGSCFNPKHTVEFALKEAARIGLNGQGKVQLAAVHETLRLVGLELDSHALAKHIGEFSGGQQQRLALARALLVQPKVLLLDEPVSALDEPLRRGLVRLLQHLVNATKLAMVVVTHDFSILEGLAQRAMVLLGGHVVEEAPWEVIRDSPRNPYTRLLQAAAGGPKPEGIFFRRAPTGCPFRLVCPRAAADCLRMPAPRFLGLSKVACHWPWEENPQGKNLVQEQ